MVARTDHLASIGIDAEPNEELASDIIEMIACNEEIKWIEKREGPCGLHWGKLFFSAKESVYKAWYPLTKSWLRFNEVVVHLDCCTRTFDVEILQSRCESGMHFGPYLFKGQYIYNSEFIITSVTVAVRIY